MLLCAQALSYLSGLQNVQNISQQAQAVPTAAALPYVFQSIPFVRACVCPHPTVGSIAHPITRIRPLIICAIRPPTRSVNTVDTYRIAFFSCAWHIYSLHKYAFASNSRLAKHDKHVPPLASPDSAFRPLDKHPVRLICSFSSSCICTPGYPA